MPHTLYGFPLYEEFCCHALYGGAYHTLYSGEPREPPPQTYLETDQKSHGSPRAKNWWNHDWKQLFWGCFWWGVEIWFSWSRRQDVRVLSLSYVVWGGASYIVWSGWGGSYIVWGRLSYIVWEGGGLSYIVWGRGGDAIHCMKGRQVPEVVNINPELRYEFGFIGGTISVSESRQFQKRSGRLYFIIERCIMHFISKLSLTNFTKIVFREPEVVTIHPGLRLWSSGSVKI